MKTLLLALIFLNSCTDNRATTDKFKRCENLCKNNGGTSYVKIKEDSFLFIDVSTSDNFDCICNNKANFHNQKAGK